MVTGFERRLQFAESRSLKAYKYIGKIEMTSFIGIYGYSLAIYSKQEISITPLMPSRSTGHYEPLIASPLRYVHSHSLDAME